MKKSTIIDNFVAPPCREFVEILYQDEDILLINKPSGLLSLSGKNPLNWDSVHYRLVHGQEGKTPAFPEAKLPHRLDLGTSGVMVVGLHQDASKHLNKQFQAGTIQKHYTAMLEGWLEKDRGQITASIAKDRGIFPKVKICEATGKKAVSEYSVLERLDNPRRTVVRYIPFTGRTHQLRIHSLALGHPILGCDLYHSENSAAMATRLMLHASGIHFEHPSSGELFEGKSSCSFFVS